VIASPHNDHDCLEPATDLVIAEVEARSPALVELAERFADTDELAAWFRTLPQRDDEGVPGDGPKVVACRPPQRLRFDASDPNCFERAARFIGAAELIDAGPVYRLATLETPNGLHTFPTRDGDPVVLDPLQSRNALRAGLDDIATRRLRLERLIGTDETRGVRGDLARARKAKAAGHTTWVHGEPIDQAIASYERALATYQERLAELPRNAARCGDAAGPVALTPSDAIDRIRDISLDPARRFERGVRRVHNGHRALLGVLALRPICIADLRDVVFLLAIAEREARRRGRPDLVIVHSTAKAIDVLDRMAASQRIAGQGAEPADAARNASPFELKIGGTTIKPDIPLLGALGRVGTRIAGNIGMEALKLKLASIGIGPPVLTSLEQELNREGLTLGPLAKPSPMLGSLAALTPEALAGRWLADKL
jgi:hypothetical protein